MPNCCATLRTSLAGSRNCSLSSNSPVSALRKSRCVLGGRKQNEGLDLLILDHLHKIKATDRYRGDPTAEIGEVSNACAALAKELDIGVLALCQLNRETEKRDDKRPQLSDLRQSGSLEQDADVVLFPYREAYYLLSTCRPSFDSTLDTTASGTCRPGATLADDEEQWSFLFRTEGSVCRPSSSSANLQMRPSNPEHTSMLSCSRLSRSGCLAMLISRRSLHASNLSSQIRCSALSRAGSRAGFTMARTGRPGRTAGSSPDRVELDQLVFRIERLPDTVQSDHVDWGFNVTNV
jgi:DnaB-like helicase C terminal domain